ncbi:MAG: hypothetical protein JO246_01325 [Frankiaceae bacterium]|nr:hypothetical protein [Frankiaceae bacterium]MBV9870988.1 hypothetical protein [Frankiaceae bacterium]
MRVDVSWAGDRCAAHPARPARGTCPRCDLPRCDADAAAFGGAGCAACDGGRRLQRRVGLLEAGIRAGLATWPVIMVGGWIATQYVYDHIFSLVVPGLVGFAASVAAAAVAGRRDRTATALTLAIAAGAGVLGTALGFHLLTGGRQGVLQPWSVVGAPYLCAIAGAVAYRVLFADPRRRS